MLGLAGSTALAVAGMAPAAAVLPALWLAALAGGAAVQGCKRRDAAALLMPAALAAMHLAWGTGFWRSWAARPRRGAAS